MEPLADATDICRDGAALRQLAERDGHLLVRGLLPAEAVTAVGERLAEIMVDHDWIEPGEALARARVNPERRCVEPQPEFMAVFYEQLACRELHALKMRPELMGVFNDLFEESAFCVPHCVMRLAFPDMHAYATPPHQDFVHFEGSRRNWAAWIPFTPIDAPAGGLAVAAGSHRHGAYDMRPSLGAGQMEIDADLSDLDWRWSPMQPGDVLIHNCLTVHRGLPNSTQAMRVSMDARYQPLSEPVGEKYLGVSHQLCLWEDLYREWAEDDPMKYYWHGMDLDVERFTFHWYDRRDERAIEMGEAGDPSAAVALENIELKHRDPDLRARARQALERLRGLQR